MWKETVIDEYEVLLLTFAWGTEGNHEIFQSGHLVTVPRYKLRTFQKQNRSAATHWIATIGECGLTGKQCRLGSGEDGVRIGNLRNVGQTRSLSVFSSWTWPLPSDIQHIIVMRASTSA